VRLLTPEAAAEQLAVSRSTVLRMISDGQLPAICLRSGRRKKVWRVREEVLQKWILAKERKGQQQADGTLKRTTNASARASDEPTAAISSPANGRALD
jgi:excisionase family DNA binding protein